MKIRTKLTLIFVMIVMVILTAVSLAIYFFSADYREHDFYMRLRNKAENTAKLLIEVDEVDLALLKRIERDNPINLPNERIRIFNFKNEELYSSDQDGELPVDSTLLNQIRLEDDIRFTYKNFEVLGFMFAYKYDRFTVIAAATDTNGFKKLENLRQILIIVFAVSLIMISVAGWIYAGKVLSPISNIVNEVDNISAASLNLRLREGNGKDELAKLAQTFNLMLNRLEAAFMAQKNFIANASHELRTPITAIAGEIEVTLLQPREREDYIKVLKSLLEDAKSLSQLSTQLLLLAQASSDNPQQRRNPLRIDEILWEAKDDLLKAHPQYNIHIAFDITLSDESLVILGDAQLIKVVFLNLMDNGCKYSTDNKVAVTLRSHGTSHILVEFANKGVGMSAEDAAGIFEPFFRSKSTSHIKGHGIGLSLAGRIMKLHNGSITLDERSGELTRFTVRFPTTLEGF